MQPSVLEQDVVATPSPAGNEYFQDTITPIRGAPFSLEHLSEHARALAADHVIVDSHPQQKRLWKQFEHNNQRLEEIYEALQTAVRDGAEIAPGSDWLLDNFYVVRDQLREIREDLPPRFYRELPKLQADPLAGYPRVYALALEIVAHTDSALDTSTLTHFIQAYQETAPLTMGELWAIPIALRLALVENLRRLADRLIETQGHRACVDCWADEILEEQPADPHSYLAEQTKKHASLAPPLVARMVQRFRDQGHDLSACWHWLVQRLASEGKSIDEIVQQEHQRQASDQVSIGNAITSMRWIAAMDWSWFFEEASLVEHELRRDPAKIYGEMDFATRDRYRHVIEILSRCSDYSEIDVARRVVQESLRLDGDPVLGHVGYYLIDRGRPAFEAHLHARPPWYRRLRRAASQCMTLVYLGSIALVWGMMLAGLLVYAHTVGADPGMLLVLGLVWGIPLSELSIGVVNYLATLLTRPRLLPKMDFRNGLPEAFATIVVIPSLMASKQYIRGLVDRLEIHYLANPDPRLTFALLLDFKDAAEPSLPEDAGLLAEARAGIAELNTRHGDAASPRFWVFHRERRWNEAENQWMGWERKRGKLSEFNDLLRGATDTSYAELATLPAELSQIRFVITLDSDTQLPLGAARGLVSTLAHPLNQPRLDENGTKLQRGYSLLQPRISINPVTANRSRFARVYSGNPHVDPYVTAVSDVYQDLFAEGSFTGKGIYDVDAFETLTGDIFPPNHILSHDLIEGCHARAGLATDIELIDDYPAQYHAYARRAHRWVRGDWQLLPWLAPRVPTTSGSRPNPLSAVSRWKIIDNLRRSLVPPTLLLALVLGWLVLPGSPAVWSAVAAIVLALPLVIHLISVVRGRPKGVSWRHYLRGGAESFWLTVFQVVLALMLLPHQAYLMLDAIIRTVVRVVVTRRRMLEWETADATERRLGRGLSYFMVEMWPAPVIAVLVGVALWFQPSAALFWSVLPVLGLWFCSPPLAYFLSQPIVKEPLPLNAEERYELRQTARRTWLFFQRFVTAEDHWLPPDNYQENPKGVIAHRTSPTNEGLFLVSTLAAHDFGYVSFHELATWLERNLENWSQVEHYRGHPYNWYDTSTLAPLLPAYISTVDSGNLAACALTLRQALLRMPQVSLLGSRPLSGIIDAIAVLADAETKLEGFPQTKARRQEIEQLSRAVQAIEGSAPQTPRAWGQMWKTLEPDLARVLTRPHNNGRATSPQPVSWDFQAMTLCRQIDEVRREFEALYPWLAQGGDPAQLGNAFETASWSEAWSNLWEVLDEAITLAEIAQLAESSSGPLAELRKLAETSPNSPDRHAILVDLDELAAKIAAGSMVASNLLERYELLAERLLSLALEMDFTFLFNQERKLFSIGYNLTNTQLDRGHYDLLASEARLASYLAIGKGDVDYQHWFHLGRPLTQVGSKNSLISWGGTMFEYLMPNLFLRTYPETLLAQSCQAATDRQIEFGRQRKVPWGVSESAFAAFDNASNYQYRSFGVPGLGLKRGLSDDLVVAPYATGLALMVRPRAGLENLRALVQEGGRGEWGFFEAIDYTPSRVPAVREKVVLGCYFAHHQGMLLTALANCLFDNRMQERFHHEPRTRAVERLLQERIPVASPLVTPHREEMLPSVVVREDEAGTRRWLTTPHTPSPRAHLLSNGQYTVVVTNAGSGYSQCQDTRITRWRSDTTCDNWGQYVYLRDRRDGTLWSTGYQPTCQAPEEYDVLFSVDKAEFRRRDGDLETHWEIAVTPESNSEMRLVTVTNHGDRSHTLDITSYAEVVLAPANADLVHPAFQKLFIETEYLPEHNALLARRRPRAENDHPLWAVHVLAVEESQRHILNEPVGYETDRAQFIGRGGNLASPQACAPHASLSGTVGPVLDPIFSLRRSVRIPRDQSVRLAFTTGFAKTREEAVAMADQFHDLRVVQRGFELAWAHAQVALRHVHLTTGKIHAFQRLASMLLYPDASKRAPRTTLAANRQALPGLWRYGVSGDYPILLVRITQTEQEGLLREVLLAHEYWRTRNFVVEVVILNEHPTSYVDAVQEQLNRIVGELGSWDQLNHRGGIFVLQGSRLSEEDRTLLLTSARVVLAGSEGALEEQIEVPPQRKKPSDLLPVRYLAPERSQKRKERASTTKQDKGLEFANSLGGFSADGREYVIRLTQDQATPAPWSNVIANESFGCLVTESGSGYTWSENSRENKLTSWSNDPVCDTPSEAIYLRDEESGEVWCPTPGPIRAPGIYIIRHGQGYTQFEHTSHGLLQELRIAVAPQDPVKLLRLKLRNDSQHPRQLSATFCVEWVLGVHREQTQLHVVTERDPTSGALLASNAFNQEFAERVAFLQVVERHHTVTGDRTEFFGRNSDWTDPAVLARKDLSGAVGAGYDPCGAVQTKFWLKAGEETEVIFLLGQCANRAAVDELLSRYAQHGPVADTLAAAGGSWDELLGTIQVKTPSLALNQLVNRWLLYQTLSCRFWGRTAFYQSSGAFGFRDQLQDSMALVYSRPDLARRQILYAASRQFEEGDVQHWWHPPAGRGVRTRFSDDLLWLPFVLAHYVQKTGDEQVLREIASYLRSPTLQAEEDERYELPEVSTASGTIYEHCVRAIEHGLRFGPHGLPLMGGGDWNDGMNRVGAHGTGESVWVAWFLVRILEQFSPLAEAMGETARADRYRTQAEQLRATIEKTAWDGAWYRRAYFDDGTPLGSAENDACQIDSLTQSWAVIAGGHHNRARESMQAAWERLVRVDDKLLLLFEPPFDQTALEPGYIKGYLPGIRENGGQYTHAATWMVEAWALLGEGDRAMQLYELLAPQHHGDSDEAVARYKVEPYVVAADVYSMPPHTGRGGWTWYTGSSAWMYRVALEHVLGFKLRGDTLVVQPCIPSAWLGFELSYRRGGSHYRITVENPEHVQVGVRTITLDGAMISTEAVKLMDDGKDHEIRVIMG